jgi:protein O-GlcNAc transferase
VAHNNLGNALQSEGKFDEAIACYGRALALDPNYAEAYCNLGGALKEVARLPEAVAMLRRALEIAPLFARGQSNLLYTLLFCPGYGMSEIYREHARWNELYAKPLAPAQIVHQNDRDPNRRLRIGYVSPDFRNHVQAHFVIPLLAAHDRELVEVTCYSDVVNEDAFTDRIRGLADRWRDVSAIGDEEMTELVRQDRIDVLVDLTMHMERNRLLVFVRKPAPVQVTWLAYPGTTGLTAIDYRLTDPWLEAPETWEASAPRCYSEESLCLPDTFWCYDPLYEGPEVNALPAISSGAVTFGNLNAFAKFSPSALRLWARVLCQVPHSRLLLLAPPGSCRQWAMDIMQAEGSEASRIEFVSRQPREQYLEVYQRIDIGLDTVPYNGHTTSLDSLWMGVPVVTLAGQTIVGRGGLSQLSNLGLTELIAHDESRFVQVASDLAADLERLENLRTNLRKRMEASPLMDSRRFARNLEAAFRQMWRTWCQKR